MTRCHWSQPTTPPFARRRTPHVPSATEKPFPAQHVCSHNKGRHGATALQKISHAHPIDSMSVYVFPLRLLRPCRQLVHSPRARTRAGIRARTPARLSRFQFFAFTLHLHLTVYQLDMSEHYSISSLQNTTTNNYKLLLYSDL